MLIASTSWFRLASLALFAVVAVGGAYAVGGGGTPVLPETPYDYESIALPTYITQPTVLRPAPRPDDNPVTDEGATLGRVLFYDTRLSQNETVSCASCHLQEHGFADPRPRSVGFLGEQTARASMALTVAGADRGFFWDQRAATLEHLALMPIQDPVEMGMTLDALTARLQATAFYPGLFADAFGTPEVTSDRIARALAQFVSSIVATNSRYDAARQAQGGDIGVPLADFSEQENRGLELFFGEARCEQCHLGDLFRSGRPTGNGLDSVLTDTGARIGRFKVVSLRNIALTAPYMHDGRFATLEDVVDHYDAGIQINTGLDIRLRGRDAGPLRMNLSADDKAALVAFLETLTDTTVATDPRWSDPFPPADAAPPAR